MLTQQSQAIGKTPGWSGLLIALMPAVAAAITTLILGLPALYFPLHPDQALYAMVARAINSGGFPYFDAWDFKPPSLYLIYALAISGPFDVSENVRTFDLIWTVITAALVAELGRRWWNNRAGLLAGLMYALVWSTGMPFWQSAQPDSLAVLPIVLALLVYDLARGRWPLLILCGVLLGFAIQLRFTVALLIPAFPIVELAGAPRSAWWGLWLRRMLWIGAGFAGSQIVLALYLLVGGALGEYIATMRYAAGYGRQGGPWNDTDGPTLYRYWNALRLAFWNWAGNKVVLTIPAFVAGVYGVVVRRDPQITRLTLFGLLTYAGIAVQAKFFTYHFGVMMPILALLAGWGWDQFVQVLSGSLSALRAWTVAAGLAMVLLLSSPEVWDNGVDYWSRLAHTWLDSQDRRLFAEAIPGHMSEQSVAQYVRDRTDPDDTIYVWGFDPMLYLLAERDPASRFLLSFPLMSDWAPERWQDEFIAELRKNQPRNIIVQRGQAGNWIVGHNIDIADYIRHFPEFQRLLDEEYEPETEILGNIVYRRRDLDGPS